MQKKYIACILLIVVIFLMILTWYRYIKYRKLKKKLASYVDSSTQDNSSAYQEIVRSLRNQEFLVNFTNYLNSSGNFTEKINKTLHILGKYTQVDRVYIFGDLHHNKTNISTYEWCKPEMQSGIEELKQIFYEPFLHEWKTQLMKDGIIHITEEGTLPDTFKSVLYNRNINSLIILPLYVYNDFFGFLGLDDCELHHWDDMDIGFLKTSSIIISNAFERSFYEEEIKNSETKFRDLFNHGSDAVFIYNTDGNIVEVNNRACETLDIPKADLLTRNIETVFPEGRVPREKLYHTNVLNPYIFESEFITSHCKIFPVEINQRTILFNSKDAILCVARDISERKEVQRQILSAVIQTEEKERGRVAQDLHDGLGPLLSSLKLYSKVLGTTSDMEKRKELLNITMEVIDESMMLIKEISNNLSPHVLNDFGLASAIQSFCKKISLTKEIEIKFDSNVFDQRFETNVEMVLFRTLKELVNNTIKHALATRIEIFLLRTENMLSLIYSDNGIGFDIKRVLDNKSSGMGISNIVNRISSITGRLMFDSQSGKGIQMKIEVELKK